MVPCLHWAAVWLRNLEPFVIILVSVDIPTEEFYLPFELETKFHMKVCNTLLEPSPGRKRLLALSLLIHFSRSP